MISVLQLQHDCECFSQLLHQMGYSTTTLFSVNEGKAYDQVLNLRPNIQDYLMWDDC